jgi:pyridoxamine 5'-phosphate oxidase family protein
MRTGASAVGARMVFTAAEREYLSSQRLGRIATAAADATPDVAPVGFRIDDDTIVVGGIDITRTVKYRNVLATGKAAFVVDDLESVEPWRPRGVKVRGPARVVEHQESAVIVIEPATVWSWGLNEGAPKRFHTVEKRDV